MPIRDPNNQFWLLALLAPLVTSLVFYFHNLRKKQTRFVWIDFVLRIFMGTVVGLLTATFAISFGYNTYFAAAASGVAGMFSEPLIQYTEKFIHTWFGAVIRDQDKTK